MKVLFVFGTRPEAIKMAPVIKVVEQEEDMEAIVAVTGQHREMLDQVLHVFDIQPHYDLNIFKSGQTLTDITVSSLLGLENILEQVQPDILLVQGDTTTVFAGALAAFYKKIPIGHIEAGLRSGNLYSPYPEEANRKLVGTLTAYHFAPTEGNRLNLLREGYDDNSIFVTGNTVIDALSYSVQKEYTFEEDILNQLDYEHQKVILLTSHRRENQGEPMERIFSAVLDVVNMREDVEVVFPVHLNPKVRSVAKKIFGEHSRIHLIEPLDYVPFSNLMSKVFFVVTDSGGVQEEAPALGKPVLVIREETERMEGVEANTAKLVGTSYENVKENMLCLLEDDQLYQSMSKAVNPYGDGHASERIASVLKEHFL